MKASIAAAAIVLCSGLIVSALELHDALGKFSIQVAWLIGVTGGCLGFLVAESIAMRKRI